MALLHAGLASGVELAALGGICGAGQFAFQNFGVGLVVGVSHRYCREQRLGVGMACVVADISSGAVLNDVTQVHNSDVIGNVLNNG